MSIHLTNNMSRAGTGRVCAPPPLTPPLRFTYADGSAAQEEWGFNCGPGAVCALLSLTPAELRPHLGEFEQKRYTNPTLMKETLERLGRGYVQKYRSDEPRPGLAPGVFDLARIQWGGPWTKPGVPMRARYRQTHWIAVVGDFVFDVNHDQWLPLPVWGGPFVKWLAESAAPKWDGTWWPTHVWEVQRDFAPGFGVETDGPKKNAKNAKELNERID